MIGFKILVLSMFFVLPILAKKRWKCELVICPPCDWRLTDSFKSFALRYLDGEISAPHDGSCENDGVKWMHYGAEYKRDNNACCCLTTFASEATCSADSVLCPPVPKIGPTELILDYFQRVTKLLTKNVSDCCCPSDQFKWVFPAAITGGKEDAYACVISGKMVNFDTSSSTSSSSE